MGSKRGIYGTAQKKRIKKYLKLLKIEMTLNNINLNFKQY